MINYQIFTDGSYRSSKNRMGIGVIWLKNGEKVYQYSKGIKGGTNNIAELSAIYVALRSIKNNINSLVIYSDSEYSIGCITNEAWKPKKNIQLIQTIKNQLIETQKLVSTPIEFVHVRGHQKDTSEFTKWNNLVDNLAQAESNYEE